MLSVIIPTEGAEQPTVATLAALVPGAAAGLIREVLAMFSAQATGLIGRLENLPADAPALAHTMKGSARAIGAFRVADAAEDLEVAIRNGFDPAEALAGLKDTVAEARAAIDAMLRRS